MQLYTSGAFYGDVQLAKKFVAAVVWGARDVC